VWIWGLGNLAQLSGDVISRAQSCVGQDVNVHAQDVRIRNEAFVDLVHFRLAFLPLGRILKRRFKLDLHQRRCPLRLPCLC
jgi:hypothetical protein